MLIIIVSIFFMIYSCLVIDAVCTNNNQSNNVLWISFKVILQKIFRLSVFEFIYFATILILLISWSVILSHGDGIFSKQPERLNPLKEPYYFSFMIVAFFIWFYHIGIEVKRFYNEFGFDFKKWISKKGLYFLYHISIFTLLGYCLIIAERNLILNDNITDAQKIKPIETKIEQYEKRLKAQDALIQELHKRLNTLESSKNGKNI